MRSKDMISGSDSSTLFEELREADKSGLPPYFGYRSLRSLKIMTIIMICFPFANTLITHVQDAYPAEPYRPFQMGVNLTFAILSLAMFFILRSRSFSLVTLANIGMVYQVLGCLYFSILDNLEPYPKGYDPRLSLSIAWMWLCIFPLIMPTTMKRVVIAGVACALTTPTVFLFCVHGLGFYAPTFMYFHVIMSSILFACISLVLFYNYDKVRMELSKRRKMGSYHLVKKVGEGGMGEVWIARHAMLRRPAAIKLIHPRIMESLDELDTTIRRFEREAQSTASLHSSHSIQLYDFGHMDDGTFFYVMEMLEGVELKDLLKHCGALPQERAVYFLRQIAHSLADAHAQNLIHRDIKPGNIFICKYGFEYDFVKVLDFGMVKDFNADVSLTDAGMNGQLGPGLNEEMLTRTGMICGTPQFMAPEMIQGQRVDARYDIYALGCVAYNMLTGRVLFSSRGHLSVMSNHLTQTPPPLRSAGATQIDQDLERLVMACLEKDPANRPQSMNEVRRVLESLTFVNPWTTDRAEAWWGNRDLEDMKNGATPLNSQMPTMVANPPAGIPGARFPVVEKAMDTLDPNQTMQDL